MLNALDTDSEKAQSLKNMLISQATGGAPRDGDYQELRNYFIKNHETKNLLPDFVRTNHDLSQLWQFIKYKFKNHDERRKFIF